MGIQPRRTTEATQARRAWIEAFESRSGPAYDELERARLGWKRFAQYQSPNIVQWASFLPSLTGYVQHHDHTERCQLHKRSMTYRKFL